MEHNINNFIPEVMNCLYTDDVLNSTSLIEIRDAFRVKQIKGKQWLIDAVIKYSNDKDQSILVIGGWLGFTSFCLYKFGFKNITEVDIDKRTEKFAKHLNRFNSNFQRITDDVNNIDVSEYDIIINSSCEHICNNTWFEKINKNSMSFLQSTDYKSHDHVNVCNSVEQMIEKYPMNLIYSGSLDLVQYQRFMLIGKK